MADGPMRREWRRMTYRVTESGPCTFILSQIAPIFNFEYGIIGPVGPGDSKTRGHSKGKLIYKPYAECLES